MSNKKYSANYDFFKTWNKEMAYLLGFIAADGHIELCNGRPNRLIIGLSKKDEEHLILLKKLLNSTHPIKLSKQHIKNYKTYEIVTLKISSGYMCNMITNLGIMNKKSLILKWIDVPEKYISHFVRGYFDGDGCITIRKNQNNNAVICILGTEHFLNGILNNFNARHQTSYHSIRKRNNIYILQFSGHLAVSRFCEWIYNNSDGIRLERKYNVYQKYKNILKENRPELFKKN